MPQKFLTIYNAGQPIDVTLYPPNSPIGFSGGAGTWNNVSRVDFYGTDGKLLCVLPSDSATTVIQVDPSFILFNPLNFTSLLGRSNASGLKGQLQVVHNLPRFILNGVNIDGIPIASSQAGASYADVFAQLASPQGAESSTAITPSPVPTFPWPEFNFGRSLIYRIRNFYPTGATDPLPIFTLEREIPTDSFASRHLPPPFAIPIALPSPGVDTSSIALRAVQRPADSWFTNSAASPQDWQIEITGFQPGTIADFWKTAVVDRYIGALRSVLDTEVISLLPTLPDMSTSNPLIDDDWRLILPVTGQSGGPLSLQMLGALGDPPPQNVYTSISCDGFLNHSGNPLAFTATLATPPPPSSPANPWMSFTLTAIPLARPAAIRIGSIDLTLAVGTAWAPWSCQVQFFNQGGSWIPRIALQTLGTNSQVSGIPLQAVTPGGQDDPAEPQLAAAAAAALVAGNGVISQPPSTETYPDIAAAFVRKPALVIPVLASSGAGSLFLTFTENNSLNQQLTLTLSATSPGNQNLDVLVIDPNPFTVALARLPDLTSAASAETNQFAQWSNSFPEGAGWRISAGAGQFQLLLPPQGIGEAMVTGHPGEPDGTALVPFRLTPPALTVLETSSQIQRYAEPGWNLRRVLGYPGERAPGAAVVSMQFEMLYGLICFVTSAGLSLSELFSRLGGFANPLVDSGTGSLTIDSPDYHPSQKQWFDGLNLQWASLYQQLLSRTGILELWNQERAFETQLSSGVSYQLRDFSTLPDHDNATNFKGGVQYALFLDELLTAVQANPTSTSAVLFEPRFSALGASGKQRAGFDNEIVFVESMVSFGMVETLTITVIGRIANLWHKAKHVTVYERSVYPSRQFYGEQPLLAGRPLLRKTAEYVEILQKTRSYPESGPAMTGFLQGAEFKSIRMNVDSAWRTDVPVYNPPPPKPPAAPPPLVSAGWTIPLWRPSAQPSDVYPEPHVVLQLAADPASGAASRVAEITNPENLFFFTDPNQKTSDTDQWPAVHYVDFALTNPVRSTGPIGGANTVPFDFPVEAGHGPFTYQVSAAATQVNVVAQRASNAMASTLANVTFMRAQSGVAYPDQKIIAAGQLKDHTRNAIHELKKVAAQSGKTKADVLSRLQKPDLQQSVVAPFKSAAGLLNGPNPLQNVSCNSIAGLATQAIQKAAIPIGRIWTKLSGQIQSAILTAGASAEATEDTLQQTLLGAVDTTFAAVQSQCGIVLADLSNLQAIQTQLTQTFNGIATDLGTLKGKINAAASPSDWNNCAAWLNRCSNNIQGAIGDIQLLLSSISYLFGNRIGSNDSLNTLTSEISGFLNDFGLAVQTVTDEVSNANKQAATDLDTVINLLTARLQPLTDALDAISTALQGAASSVNSIAATLRSYRDSLKAKIQATNSTVIGEFENVIGQVLGNWPSFDQLLASACSAIQAQICATFNTLLGDITGSLAGFLDSGTLDGLLPNSGDLSAALDTLQDTYDAQLDSVAQLVRESIPVVANPIGNAAVLLRAFGDAPVVPNLGFTPPNADLGQIAYFFTSVSDTAAAAGTLFNTITQDVPVSRGLLSAVTQASTLLPSSGLSQLGIQGLPAKSLLDRIVPDSDLLSTLGLGSIFPNLAGIDLSRLFSGINVPSLAGTGVHISHQLDPQTLKAALDVTLDFPIENNQEVTLFSIGPATVTVKNCNFHADVHVSGGVGQSVTETSSGSITADWNVYIGGTLILTFQHTALTFDQGGHFHFDIAPPRVRLAAVLQFLADFLSNIKLGGGFSLNMLPTAIQCVLTLPLPDLSGAVFGITNLRLACSFALVWSPDFALQIAAGLGTKTAPFTLTVFILGGAGWFTAAFTYTPRTGKITANVSIGILASASLSISLGPLKGGVYFYFGITAEYHSEGGLNLGILIMLQGRVSLLGLVDAEITLLLEAEYTSGGGLIGHGEVDVSIKICWCFTLDIHQSVTYTFGKSSSSSQSSQHIQAGIAPVLAAAAPQAGPPQQDPSTGLYAKAANNRINYLS